MAFSTEQWAILLLVLVLGWLLGMASRSGSGRWKRELRDERERHETYRREHEARIAAANARIAELERDRPVGAGVAGGSIGAAAAGRRDDLSLIHGVGRPGESRLNEHGIHSYRDIEKMSREDEAALEGKMGLEPGLIERDGWREQAKLLRTGKADAHRERFGR